MRTQREYMNFIKEEFAKNIINKRSILDAYCYNDDRARSYIKRFIDLVKSTGLKFSNCHHANGIGNNNEYTIFIEGKDSDGFVVRKNIATFYYCYGIYGGCYVSLEDLATGEKFIVGRAR